ncbi:MAG: ATP-grasp domain-containing protein [Blastochloris sp.]|nr:ATP-grasp domain-containing protein [Blastochloris sp.]
MFNKILIANRGEIAVRIVRTCRDMGIPTVALYEAADIGSLHVRLADECVPLKPGQSYRDMHGILNIAREIGADAIHPGYGFLAEQPEFVRACEAAGITFIGPPSDVVAALHNRLAALERARVAGFATPAFAPRTFGENDLEALQVEAERLGYPLLIKPCAGGFGRGARLVYRPAGLIAAAQHAQAEANIVFGESEIYLERAILPTHYIEVQTLGDQHGNLIHLGERQTSLPLHSQRIIEEAPAPCLSPEQREEVWRQAIKLARLFGCRNACTVEFVVDAAGQFYFTEIKPRIQIEHPVTEMVTSLDIVREQIRLAAGEPLRRTQADIHVRGWSMLCRVTAEDPWNDFLPSPGRLHTFSLPGGPHVRVDTYAYSGCDVPAQYDPMLAKVIVWDDDRAGCVRRMRRALGDFTISGVLTNLPLLQRILADDTFTGDIPVSRSHAEPREQTDYAANLNGLFSTLPPQPTNERELRDMAVAAAIAYMSRTTTFQPTTPARTLSGWHRDSRRVPE